MPLVPGQVLNDRYRIAKLLAQGGFGAVYRAWDLNLKTAVALKENLTVSAESLKQFTLEARLLAGLRQENLPYVIDYFSLPGQGQYLVMEFVEGQDLQSMLDQKGPLIETQAVTWLTQVCNALIYLHGQSPPVIHRDIKPANIKITPKGQVMLVDFGIAKVYDPSSRTTAGARAVTSGFSPPEQYGSGRTDARSDVYALGATLYAALTGKTPLDSLQRRLGAEMSAPRQANPAISAAMEQVITRAMELDAAKRYPSVRDFKHALTSSMLSPAQPSEAQVVQRAAPAIPQTQAAMNAGAPAAPASGRAYPDSPPAPQRWESAPARAAMPRSKPAAAPRKVSALMIFGIVFCLLTGAAGLVGGAIYLFGAATPTKAPASPDLSWATQTMLALITEQTRAPTATTAWTPTFVATNTAPPVWTPSPTAATLATWTPIPSPTPTLSPTGVLKATWYPCSGTYASRLHVGDRAFVSSDPPLSNRVRSQPDTNSEVLGYLEVGERMEILEGPACFGGWIWWRVRSLEKNLTGWTAEGDENDYWLVPMP